MQAYWMRESMPATGCLSPMKRGGSGLWRACSNCTAVSTPARLNYGSTTPKIIPSCPSLSQATDFAKNNRAEVEEALRSQVGLEHIAESEELLPSEKDVQVEWRRKVIAATRWQMLALAWAGGGHRPRENCDSGRAGL